MSLFKRKIPQETSSVETVPNIATDDNSSEKAVFFNEGTTEDYEEMIKADKGLDKWYKRIINL